MYHNCIDAISDLLISPRFNRTDISHLRSIREKVFNAVRQVDSIQKRDIIVFLHTNQLIRNDITTEYILDMSGADLNDVHFVKSSTFQCGLRHLSLRCVLGSNMIFSGCFFYIRKTFLIVFTHPL